MGGKSITVGSGGPTNTPVPTATQPAAGSGNFSLATQTSSLVPSGGGAVTGTFSTDVFFNSQGVSTKNFQVAFHFDSAKIKVASVGPAAAHLQGDANSGAGASSYVLLRTNVGDAFTKVYGTAGGAAEKIGTITFQFQGTNKQANVTFDAAGSWIMNSVGDVAVTAAAPDYCYFMTGGTCDVTSPTNTPAAISTSTPAPTNTPVPTATPIAFPTTTPNSMGDNAQYIADDLPTTATPGQVITAHITMKNTGTTTWKATERFHGLSASPQCAGSACRWGSSGVLVGADVAPQATYQFTLNLTAPTTADTYDAFWQMVQSGELFGQKGGKRITVAAAVAPTTTVPACTKSTFPDATGDGKVCMVDFQRWVNELTHADGLNTTTADFNCPADGAVSVIDFQIWVNYVRDHGLSTGCGS